MRKDLMQFALTLVIVAAVGCATWAVCPYVIWNLFPNQEHRDLWNRDFVVSVTAFSVGVLTFFGVLRMYSTEADPQVLSGERLRTALACSLVIMYLFIVSFTAFVGNALTVGPVTKTFMESFSSIIGITIAFYFGASAATEIFAKDRGNQAESKIAEQQK